MPRFPLSPPPSSISRTPGRRALAALAAASAIASAPLSAHAQEALLPSLRASAKANSADAASALALGKALRRAGHFADAQTELQRGLALANASKTAAGPALVVELARTRIDQRDGKGALAACDQLDKSALANACRAEAYLFQNRAAEALAQVEIALRSDQTLYEAKVAEGRAVALTGRIADAETAFRAAIASAETRPRAHHSLGLFLLAEGKRDAGVSELKRASVVDPNDPDIAFDLGQVLGRTAEARAEFARAVKIRPGFAAAHAELARAMEALGEAQAAEASAIEALRLDASSSVAHIALGRVRISQRKWDDALKEGEAAKKLAPASAGAELVIADAQAGEGHIDLAVDSYQKAFSFDRQDGSALVRGAHACLAVGRNTTGRAFAEKLTVEFPKLASGWVEFGDAASKQGDRVAARSAYDAALKLEGQPAGIDRDLVKKKLAALK